MKICHVFGQKSPAIYRGLRYRSFYFVYNTSSRDAWPTLTPPMPLTRDSTDASRTGTKPLSKLLSLSAHHPDSGINHFNMPTGVKKVVNCTLDNANPKTSGRTRRESPPNSRRIGTFQCSQHLTRQYRQDNQREYDWPSEMPVFLAEPTPYMCP